MNPLLSYYYLVSNRIDLSTFNKDLLESLNFYEHDGNKFEQYLSDNKILVNSENFRSYLELFVVINFGNKYKCYKFSSNRYCLNCGITIGKGFTVEGNKINKFLDTILNAGYVLSVDDVFHYAPFLIEYYDNSKFNNSSDSEKKVIEKYLYANITRLRDHRELVELFENSELNLLLELQTANINKTSLKEIYSEVDIKPNASHLTILLDCPSNKKATTWKCLIDFFDAHGVGVNEMMFRNFGNGKNDNQIIDYLNKKKSFKDIKHYEVNLKVM